MAAKRSTKSRPVGSRKAQKSSWINLLLTLTLVPLVIGILLIGAWALDYYLWEPPENQVAIAVFFILASFAASNALQRLWQLAAGWTLLIVADWLLLTSYNVILQGMAFFLGGVGLILLVVEFYRNWQRRKRDESRKKT